MEEELILKAGKISAEVKKFARTIIKKDVPLLEIAEKIEAKIEELGGEPAFPTNLGINDIAAHYTPSYNDEAKARGLLKVDLGVHLDGWVADTAFSIDLENDEENKKLIKTSKKALENVSKILKSETTLQEIGRTVEQTAEENGFTPIANLNGHQIEQFELHAGATIPNVEIQKTQKIGEGLFAIEPFITNGQGKTYEGKPSGIYALVYSKNPRTPLAREILEYIEEKHYTLPFCSRWIVKEFGTKALIALRELEQNGIIHQYPQLIESGHGKVAQSENTFLIKKNSVKTTTL